MAEKCDRSMPLKDAERVLAEEDTGYLAMCRDGEPYCVPVSYAFLGGKIVFHCALKGRKLDFIGANPKVSFAVSRHPDRARPHHPETGCTYRYESVICSGRARIVEDLDERFALLCGFLEYFNARLGRPAGTNPITKDGAARVACVEISPEAVSGRRQTKLKS